MTADMEVTVTVPGDLVEKLMSSVHGPEALDVSANTSDISPGTRSYCLLAAAVKRKPRPFQKDDRVRLSNGASSMVGTVVAVRDDWVKVEWNEGINPVTYDTHSLIHEDSGEGAVMAPEPTTSQYELQRWSRVIAESTSGVKGAIPEQADVELAKEFMEKLETVLGRRA